MGSRVSRVPCADCKGFVAACEADAAQCGDDHDCVRITDSECKHVRPDTLKWYRAKQREKREIAAALARAQPSEQDALRAKYAEVIKELQDKLRAGSAELYGYKTIY